MLFLKKTINLIVYLFLINFYFTASVFAQNVVINNNTPSNQLSPEVKQKILEARQRAETAFDFKTGHFKQGITNQERQQLYNDLLDSLVTTDDEYYRFDRTEKQPFIEESERQEKEQHINELLDRCIEYIGKDDLPPLKASVKDDNLKLKLELPNTDDSQVLLKNIQINYLANKVYQCSHFLYGNYSLQDFEYYDVTTPKTALDRKRQMLELFYEDIYLEIKKADLLRVIPSAYYPKSIVREAFYYSQLMEYIKKLGYGIEVMRVNLRFTLIHDFNFKIYKIWLETTKHLNHENLAISFFKTRELWLQSITYYINEPDIDNKYCDKNKIGIPLAVFDDGARERISSFYVVMSKTSQANCKRFIVSDELLSLRDKNELKVRKYLKPQDLLKLKNYLYKGEFHFKENITEQEKQIVVDIALDDSIVTDLQLYRLNRWESNALPEKKQYLEQNINEIKKLLLECINYNSYKEDMVGINYYNSLSPALKEIYARSYSASLYVIKHLNSGLEPLAKQCVEHLYGEHYNPANFMQYHPLSGKKQQAEEAYIKAYKLMKKNKLLRSTSSAFYPLSLVKEQAKKTGFDEFLLKKEMEMKKEKMDYQKVLIEFYGSYKQWAIDVSDYIQ